MPQVSVIMSTHSRNHGDKYCPNMLRRALDSILGQLFRDFELILIDDASKDGSEQVCREYERKDSRIRFYRFEKSLGRPAKRYNDGMRLANSDYFMFMFDDDVWLPNAIADLYGRISTSPKTCGMIYSLVDFVNAQTGAVTKNFGGPWNMEVIRHHGNILTNCSVIVRREAINAVGGYDEDPVFIRLCDWDLWIRIGEKFSVSRLEKQVGICYYANRDSLGLTVPLTDAVMMSIRAKQKIVRPIRLKGEMGRRFRIRLVKYQADAALTRWCIGYLGDALKKDGVDAEIVSVSTPQCWSSCESADAVLFYRSFDAASLDLFRRLKANGKFLMYFIDDYIFQPGCKYAPPNQYQQILPFFTVANALVTSNPKLLEKMPSDKIRIVRRIAIDQETINTMDPGRFVRGPSTNYSIGWLAGIGRREMNDFVKAILQSIDAGLKDTERATFSCFGNHSLGSFKKINVVERAYIDPNNWRGLYQTYRSFVFNVVINPLNEKEEFFHYKTELKYLETGAMRVPLVTARTYPFTEIIREGENGFFASTPAEFAEKVLMICRNPSLAEKIGTAAYNHVRKEYNSVQNARKFLADTLEAITLPRS